MLCISAILLQMASATCLNAPTSYSVLVRNGGHTEKLQMVFSRGGDHCCFSPPSLSCKNKPQPNTQRNKTHVLEKPVPTGEWKKEPKHLCLNYTCQSTMSQII